MFAAIFDLEYMASSLLRLNVQGKCAISMVVQFTVGNLVWTHAVRREFTYQKCQKYQGVKKDFGCSDQNFDITTV